MNKHQYLNHILNILAYDNIIQKLSISCRHSLCREYANNLTSIIETALQSENLSQQVLGISIVIIENKWQRPVLKYNESRHLQVYNNDLNKWQQFNPNDYV